MTALTNQSAEPIPGYVLKERLGAGGYGEVWKAEAPGGLLKAIKFVYGYHDEDRAARELKALNRIKQVRHPFLLSLERIEIIDGQLVIVTELADESLKDVFAQRRGEGLPGIPRDELIQFMRDTADALDYMNEKFQLQHLDIKPENLLLVGGRIKVGDFGLVKDIHDHTMSLMGGLTPIYAPPEVFDGAPSRRSDQYSLAIVFQHMLTGDVPFTGRTAAQLASQHLNDRPRLSSLPPDDRPIIEKALAKDPNQRFASCREMVERLAGRPAARPAAEERGAAPSAGAAGVAVRRTLGRTELMPGEEAVPANPSVEQRISRQEALHPTPAGFDGDTYVPQAAPAARVIALPPLENAEFALRPRPTVFVGVGGIAAGALKALRTRVVDRFGRAADVPAFPVLLIDTDVQLLKDMEFSDGHAAFSAAETLPIPLRRPQEYKSANHQTWLSRRWLYNIPRSLKTEGLRPLGRLALAAHASQILERLEQAIAAAVSPEALALTADRLGAALESEPRIVIVSSISGGTGGGAALDVAYFARQALADLGLGEGRVDGVLTHGLGRHPQARELAQANAFAFLREWRHYQRRGYPGDRSCGLPPCDAPPFDAAYLVHLGADLNEDGFAAGVESVANYLYLDSFTAAGDFLQRCRRVNSLGADQEPTLRSFGVCSLGAAGPDQFAGLVDTLCRGVLDRWRGHTEQTRVARLTGAAAAGKGEEISEPPLDPRAVERTGGLRIDLDEWLRRIQQIVEAILRAEPEAFFASLADELLPPERDHEPPGDLPKVAHDALRAINAVLGHRETEGEYHEPPADNVTDILEQRLEMLAGRQAIAVQRCVWERLQAPRQMVRSAQHAVKEYDELLRSIDQKARAARQETEEELVNLQHQVRAFRPVEPRRGGSRHAPPTAPQQLLRQMLLDYARRRLTSICLQGACKLAQAVSRQLALSDEELKDLSRVLDKVAATFPVHYDEHPEHSVVAALRSRTPELVSLLDEQFRSAFFPADEGFRAALRKEFQFAERLPEALREAARRVAAEAVRSVDLAGTLFPEGEDALKVHERLAGLMQAAQPRLASCGGAARALLVLPEAGRDGRLPAMFAARFGQPPTTVFDPHSDAAFCCEMEQIPATVLAATLIDHRRDFAEAAARLHTRNDVSWSPWPRPSDSASR